MPRSWLIGDRTLAQQRQQRIQQREQRQQGEGEDPHLRGGDDHRLGLAAALQPQRRLDADDHPLQQQRHALEQFVLGYGLLPDALRLLAAALKGGQHHPVQHQVDHHRDQDNQPQYHQQRHHSAEFQTKLFQPARYLLLHYRSLKMRKNIL